jgi:hypothetical protein
MREAVLDGHGYSAGNGAALTPVERELLVQWIDGGAPERPKAIPDEYSRLPGTFIRISSPDPLATLDRYQAESGGLRVIVPGLGLALRASDRLVVIDRAAGPERLIGRGIVVPSLAAHLAALPASTTRTRISDAAYVIGPLDEPRTEVAEIESEGPDRFWCPMHPDVRRPEPGTCPRCNMRLVDIPAMSTDPFTFDVLSTKRAGAYVQFRLRVTRGKDRKPAGALLTVHERPFHLFVVDSTLEVFRHVHPDMHGDEMRVSVPLPRAAARYHLIADFAPADALPQLRMTTAEIPGSRSGAATTPPSSLDARMIGEPARAGQTSRVAFTLTDRQTAAAPADLEPYLGAAAHLFVMDEALKDPQHAHPIEVTGAGLAEPAFEVRFPRAGRYVMWLQVQRAGRVETMRVTADVSK